MQHYSHIAAFALASALDADIILPPAVARKSFDKTYSQIDWSLVPLDTMLDVDYIVAHWSKKGMQVYKVSASSQSRCDEKSSN